MSKWPRTLRRNINGTALMEYRDFPSPDLVEPGWSDDEMDAAVRVAGPSNWPAFYFEPGKGAAGGKIFNSESDVPAGWLDHPTGESAPAVVEEKNPNTVMEAVTALIEARAENRRLRDTVKMQAAELEHATKMVATLQEALSAAEIVAEAAAEAAPKRTKKAAQADA